MKKRDMKFIDQWEIQYILSKRGEVKSDEIFHDLVLAFTKR